MRDPIQSFNTIKENYIRYVETAFGTKFESIEEERREKLNTDRVLYRKPWIEPLPDYKSSGKIISQLTIEDVPGMTVQELETFKGLVNTGLFTGAFPMHFHQALMLKKAMSGKHCIITSGTGSGKTESFLLPLFAQLSKELAVWKSMSGVNPTAWWSDPNIKDNQVVDEKNNFSLAKHCQQRSNDKRPAAVRALILYPMNALVEDQLTRLRKALDSDNTREWLDKNAKGNRVYFGRYNSSTPVSGELYKFDANSGTRKINNFKIQQLKDELKKTGEDAENIKQYILQNPAERSEDLIPFFPRLDGAEMRSRFDMQISPPDILITNYSMLSIILMRDVDNGIIEETRKWLACEDEFTTGLSQEEKIELKKERIFHLVIDELHLYRGTQGTEVAYLLKIILNRLNLSPDHPQLRILASSASLDSEDPKSLDYIQDFFGVSNVKENFEVIKGENNPVNHPNSPMTHLPIQPFLELRDSFYKSKGEIGGPIFIHQCMETAKALGNFSGSGFQSEHGIQSLMEILLSKELELRERMHNACLVDGKERAVCSLRANGDTDGKNIFAETLFGTGHSEDMLTNALSGLLIARSLFDEEQYKNLETKFPERKLPRFRFHYFFRNIEGLWASVKPDDIDDKYRDNERTAGRIYPQAKIKSSKGYRVLELLYCDNCGSTFFGGSRLRIDDNKFELLPLSPNIEGIPEKTPHKLLERRSYQEYAVFWPMGKQEYIPHEYPAGYWRQPVIGGGLDQSHYSAYWEPSCLNVFSGDIDTGAHTKAEAQPNNWIKGYYFKIEHDKAPRVDVALTPQSSDQVDTHKATPSVCPSCGVNHQKRHQSSPKHKTSSIRGFRTGFAKSSQMFAKELLYQLPNNEKDRKLVVFSDSREDAAQVANGIERNHFTDLLRELLIRELNNRLIFKHDVLKAFKSNKQNDIDKFKAVDLDMFNEIELVYHDANAPGSNPNLL